MLCEYVAARPKAKDVNKKEKCTDSVSYIYGPGID